MEHSGYQKKCISSVCHLAPMQKLFHRMIAMTRTLNHQTALLPLNTESRIHQKVCFQLCTNWNVHILISKPLNLFVCSYFIMIMTIVFQFVVRIKHNIYAVSWCPAVVQGFNKTPCPTFKITPNIPRYNPYRNPNRYDPNLFFFS